MHSIKKAARRQAWYHNDDEEVQTYNPFGRMGSGNRPRKIRDIENEAGGRSDTLTTVESRPVSPIERDRLAGYEDELSGYRHPPKAKSFGDLADNTAHLQPDGNASSKKTDSGLDSAMNFMDEQDGITDQSAGPPDPPAKSYTRKQRRLDDKLSEVDRNRTFLDAVKSGQTARVKHLIDLGINLDFVDDDSFTALHLACFYGLADTVHVLLKAGSNVRRQQQQHALGGPLIFAIAKDHPDIVKQLIAAGADVDEDSHEVGSPLHAAIALGNFNIVKLLLVNGAKPWSQRRLSTEIFSILQELRAASRPVWPDSFPLREEYTGLELAAELGAIDMVRLLVAQDLNLITGDAFRRALHSGNLNIAEYFLGAGLQLDVRDIDSRSLLHIAVAEGQDGMAAKFINQNFEIDARDRIGRTPLMLAIQQQRTACVSLLLRNGANVDLMDNGGFDARAIAIETKFEPIINILENQSRLLADFGENYSRMLADLGDASTKNQEWSGPYPEKNTTISTALTESTQVFSRIIRTDDDTSATSFSLEPSHKNNSVDALDRLTIRSQASGVTLALPETEEQQLITVFVQQLWQTMHKLIGHIPEEDIDEENLEMLLKMYSSLMSQSVPVSTRFERGAIDFVRSRRRKIARRFNALGKRSSNASEHSPVSVSGGDEDLTTRDISAWLKDVTHTEMDMPLESTIIPGEYNSDANRISDLFQALPDMQRFLVENEAWEWFESKLLHTCNTQSMLAGDILSRLEKSGIPTDGPSISVRFALDWEPRVFLQDQFPSNAQPDICNVITFTSSQGRVQATTCEAYIHSTWPTIGPRLLQAITTVVRDNVKQTTQLPHNASATVDIEDKHLIAYITAIPSILSDIGELLGWIGAACRPSPDGANHSFCQAAPLFIRPKSITQDAALLQCDIGYDFSRFEVTEASQSDCWLLMLRNVSIAEGFFVPTRLNNEQGLEISLPLMTLLGETPWADTFNDKFILKGFSTMFVPRQVLPGSILWHFRRDENDNFMSYAKGEASCINKSSVSTADISWLYQQRHYVGWAPKAEVHLGKDRDLYGDLENPDASPPRPGMALETTTISCGYHLDAWQSYSKAYCQQHWPALGNDDYVRHLIHLSESNFVLYDAGTRRAWLVDGASTLLHITCCQLRLESTVQQWDFLDDVVAKYATREQKPLSVLKDPENRRYIIRQEYDSNAQVAEADIQLSKPSGHTFNDISATNSAQIQNGDIHNTTTNNFNFGLPPGPSSWRFQDLVASNYNYLIKAQEQERLNSEKIRFTDRDQLEGWSFLDIVKQSSFLIRPRMVYLQPSGRSWTGYTRAIGAVTLMADGFGDLITPGGNVCEHWLTVPKGADYLATTIGRLIFNSEEHGRKSYFPSEIAKDVRWHQPSHLFDSCRCPEHECDPVQVILPRLKLHTKRPNVALETYKDGGVIFGKSKKFRMWFPRDAHMNPEVVSKDTVEYSDPEEDVRRQSLDSDFQVPVTDYESTAPRSDEPVSDLRSAITASDLLSETPPTSLGQTSISDVATRQTRIDALSQVPSNPVAPSPVQATPYGKLALEMRRLYDGEEPSTSSSAPARQVQQSTKSRSGILGKFTAFSKKRRK